MFFLLNDIFVTVVVLAWDWSFILLSLLVISYQVLGGSFEKQIKESYHRHSKRFNLIYVLVCFYFECNAN